MTHTFALGSDAKGARGGVLAVAAHTDVVVPEVASTLEFVRAICFAIDVPNS
jgi:hypothetical protein